MSFPQDTQETNNLYLLLIAESRVHGMLVAPKTSTSLLSTPTPAIKKDKDKHKYKFDMLTHTVKLAILSRFRKKNKPPLPVSSKAFNNVMIHKALAMDKTCIFFPVIRLQCIQIKHVIAQITLGAY